MQRSEAVDLVMSRLGKRTGLNVDVVLELKQAQNDLELGDFLPWFLTKALSGITTIENVRTVTLPSDFLRETESKWWLVTTDGVKELIKGSYDELYRRELFDVDYLSSCYYAIVGSTLYNFPTPTSAMSITGFYFGKDVVLSTDQTENEWLNWAPGMLVARAGMRMAKTLRDEAAYNLFKDDYSEAQARTLAAHIAREQAAMLQVMGG